MEIAWGKGLALYFATCLKNHSDPAVALQALLIEVQEAVDN
jgi:hypothetical protein